MEDGPVMKTDLANYFYGAIVIIVFGSLIPLIMYPRYMVSAAINEYVSTGDINKLEQFLENEEEVDKRIEKRGRLLIKLSELAEIESDENLLLFLEKHRPLAKTDASRHAARAIIKAKQISVIGIHEKLLDICKKKRFGGGAEFRFEGSNVFVLEEGEPDGKWPAGWSMSLDDIYNMSLVELSNGLPGLVTCKKFRHKVVGRYTSGGEAYVIRHELTLVNPKTGLVIERKLFVGGRPPSTIYRSGGGASGAGSGGAAPSKNAINSWISSFRKTN